MKLKENQQRRSECAEAMLEFQQTAESPAMSPDLKQTDEGVSLDLREWFTVRLTSSLRCVACSFPWQSKCVRHKRYSDYNSAAIMLDRTREKKKDVLHVC